MPVCVWLAMLKPARRYLHLAFESWHVFEPATQAHIHTTEIVEFSSSRDDKTSEV